MNKPWETEGNRHEFEAHGLKCLMLRHPEFGNWCGYVFFPEIAQARSKVLNRSCVPEDPDFDVHGGVTCNGCGIDDNPDYCLGFDCAHAWDFMPATAKLLGRDAPRDDEIYRDKQFVINECTQLAQQMAAYFKEKEHEYE